MTRAIRLATVSGVVCVCGAAPSATAAIENLQVTLTFSETTLWVGESTTATLYASWDGPADSYLSAVNIDLLSSSDNIAISNLQNVAWNQAATNLSGTADSIVGGNIFGLAAAQATVFDPVDGANPILITTFTVTATGVVNDLFFTAAQGPHGFTSFVVLPDRGVTPQPSFYGVEVFSSERLTLVPSTGVLSIAGVCGLAGLRRRR